MATVTNIIKHLENMEDYRTTGYIVSGTRNSGITIAYGIDLSQPPYNTEQGLRDAGFSEEFISKCVELDILGKTVGQIEDENRDPLAIAKQIKIPNTKEEKEKQVRLFIERNKKLDSKYANAMDDKTFISYSTMTHWGGGKGMSKEERDAVSDPTKLSAIDRKAYVIGVINDAIDAKIEENGTITSEEYSQIIYDGQNSVENFRTDSPMNTDTLNRERAFVGGVDNYMDEKARNEFIEQQDSEYAQSTEPSGDKTYWRGRVYDTKTKKWYHTSVKWNKDKTEYELIIKDAETQEVLDKNNETYKALDKAVVHDALGGKADFKKQTDAEGNISWTGYGGVGRFQLADTPIVTNTDYDWEGQQKVKGGKSVPKETVNKYQEWEKNNKEDLEELEQRRKNLELLIPGSSAYVKEQNRIKALELKINKSKAEINKELYTKALGNVENEIINSRALLKNIENEIKAYTLKGEPVPQDLINQMEAAKISHDNLIKRRTELRGQGEIKDDDYVLKEENQITVDPVTLVTPEEEEEVPVVTKKEVPVVTEEVVPEVLEEGDEGFIGPAEDTRIDYDGDGIPDDAPVDIDRGTGTDVPGEPKERKGRFGKVAGAIFEGAGTLLDTIGGPSAIISYIMGKKGLEAAMKEVEPQKMPELSPLFHQHLRQVKELSKKGFHPNEVKKIRKGIDNAYQLGLENAVRGTGGDRAKFLAQSGVLDAKRSSALLDFAAKDAGLQRQNQDKYVDAMMFKENFEAKRSEKLRTEDMQMQLANKKAAADFTSAAFSNLMSGFGGGNRSLIRDILKTYHNPKSPSLTDPMLKF